MKLGVCYYPEHWPESQWPDDAKRMRAMGITVVRIGEFAWSRLEPSRDNFNFAWLHRALDVLHSENLEVVLGTPTATPPKWLIDEHPSILAIGEDGNVKGFGSRRHYCFSSSVYREECHRIVEKVLSECGDHPAISTWQTDNEYGCHSTIVSYSEDALAAFRLWCKARYKTIDKLNELWGNVFWSMEYTSFEQIPLPMLSVTELNPAHRLAFWRFSSDQVASFNRLQVDLIRAHSPGSDVMHNYMGNFTEFDHYDTGADLEIAAWDNYPLGFLDRDGINQDDLQKWFRTGHPDSSAFHHDLYRGIGRLWVIEQQPGPVNWAPHNPAPLPGMVRLWALEAMAHGAELMSWFRWRQLPMAQEQMHTGLLLPDGTEDEAAAEVRTLHAELKTLKSEGVFNATPSQAPVALVFDYAGDQMLRIQPQGINYAPLEWVQQVYTALRRSGVDVDIVSSKAELKHYKLVVLANSVAIEASLQSALENYQGHVVVGPRCGSKTIEYAIPQTLPPGSLQQLLAIKISRVESLPDFVEMDAVSDGNKFTAVRWREKVISELQPQAMFDDGWGFYYCSGRVHYLNACLALESLVQFMHARLEQAGIKTMQCSEGLRVRQFGDYVVALNYGPQTEQLDNNRTYVLGGAELKPTDVAIWRSE